MGRSRAAPGAALPAVARRTRGQPIACEWCREWSFPRGCTPGRMGFWIRSLSLPFFFFQAEDGIRDLIVTGVQTCALPIYAPAGASAEEVYKFTSSARPFNAQTWRDLETYRKLFPRALVVKGIMDPKDALDRKSVV